LAGEDASSDEDKEIVNIGRRIFGPISGQGNQQMLKKKPLDEFEEPFGSDDGDDVITTEATPEGANALYKKPVLSTSRNKDLFNVLLEESTDQAAGTGGAWSRAASKKDPSGVSDARRRKQTLNAPAEALELDFSKAAVITKQPKRSKQPSTLNVQSDGEGSDGDDAPHLPFAIPDQELIKRAFAGADVVGEFEAEKRQAIEDEDEKIIDNTIPGWGSWTGQGVSKKEKQRNKGRFLTKQEGIKEQNRKDVRLERVIINEKRVRKNGKYLASNLPHPFESRQQYERSLRLPVGPEWNTKETFQEATKPRILIKQGIIAPMARPLL